MLELSVTEQDYCKFVKMSKDVFLAVYLDDIWVNQQISPTYYVIIYADDILLISSSICELQRIFDICERELMWLDMVINVKKILLYAHWPKKRLYRK